MSKELADAINSQDLKALQAIINKEGFNANILLQTEGNKTPLMLAASLGNLEMVAALLKSGSNVNSETRLSHNTPLTFAIQGGNIGVIRMLLKAGAEVNHEGGLGYPIHDAISSNRLDILKLLIEYKANITAPAGMGQNALTLAVNGNKKEIVKFLLSFPDFDLNKRTPSGGTLLDSAISDAMDSGDLDIVKQLLEAHINPFLTVGATSILSDDKPLMSFKIPLDHAREKKSPELIKLLEEYQAKFLRDLEGGKFSPEQREHHRKIVQNYKSKYFIKETGHALGISADIRIDTPEGDTETLRAEGNSRYRSLLQLHHLLKGYHALPYYNTIEETYHNLEKFSSGAGTFTTKMLYDKFKNDEMVAIPLGFQSKEYEGAHDTSIIFYKDYFVICNRGLGKEAGSGAQVYRLTETEKSQITPEFIEKLTVANLSDLPIKRNFLKI